MRRQRTALNESLAAQLALVRPLAGVYPSVRGQVALLGKRPVALRTRKGPFAGVRSQMNLQEKHTRETAQTLTALMRLFAGVRAAVHSQIAALRKGFVADFALEGFDAEVTSHVQVEATASGERFFAEPAVEWTFAGVRSDVC